LVRGDLADGRLASHALQADKIGVTAMATCVTALIASRADLRVFRDTRDTSDAVSPGNWLSIGTADGRTLLRLNITDATPDELDRIAASFNEVKGAPKRPDGPRGV
jgi:hypothetical protein